MRKTWSFIKNKQVKACLGRCEAHSHTGTYFFSSESIYEYVKNLLPPISE